MTGARIGDPVDPDGRLALLAVIASTVSYLTHAYAGGVGWAAWLGGGTTPLSVDGMILAASTALLPDSRSGGAGWVLPWALLVTGQRGQPGGERRGGPSQRSTGRVIAA